MVVRRGEVYENPVCGERVVIRVGNDETGGQRIVWDLYLEPGGAVVGEHFHSTSSERFTLVRGKLGLKVNGQEQIMESAGANAFASPGTPHYFWNAGKTEARILVEMRGRADRFEQMVFRQLFGLAQDGLTNAQGMPNLLQAAVTTMEFSDVARFTKPPWPVQRLLFGTLSPVAKLMGYHGLDEKYVHRKPSSIVEPEPLPSEVSVPE